jgi:hypothetical protein
MKQRSPDNKKKETPAAPFFQKEGGQSFFGGEDAFFTKSAGQQNNNIAVQKKCSSCDEEEKVQKKDELPVQRKGDDGDATPPPPPAAEPAKEAAAPAASAFHFIAEDGKMPEPGQMTKAAFMDRLKTEVCQTVNSALSGTPFSADNCPYIRASFEKHENSSPAQIEALIIRYCPAAAKATGAEDVIRQMKMRVYAAAVQWAKSGGDLSGAAQIFGVAGDIGNAVSKAASGVGSAVSGLASNISNLFFKENAGGAASASSPQAVMQSLGKGSSMDSGTKSKMEGAFDSNFSNVEIHTDSKAAQLSKDMNARAFAVGNHIAFAGGEYQPGTLTGDALMAHELAHTIQQSDGRADGAQTKGSAYSALEEDADSTAVNVMSKLTGKDDKEFKGKVNKGLKTGLTISRCEGCSPSKPAPVPAPTKNMIDEIVEDPGKSDKGRVINVRDGVNQNAFVQDLAQIDILGEAGATAVNKKVGGKVTNVFEINIFITSLTETWVKDKFNTIFPEGTEFTITKKTDPKYTALQDLIAAYRKKHPNSFSRLQGHNQLSSSCAGACIGTFNRGVQNLYGSNTINTGPKNMDDTAFGTIDKLKAKGFISKANTIAATYAKTMKIPENAGDITLSTSIAGEMNDIVQKEEDGVHPFLFSLGNGYHSITIIFYKMNGKTEIVWRDQHWEDAGNKAPKTIAEVDERIKDYLAMRAKSWAREFYNKKNTPNIEIYKDIPEGEKKEAAKKDAESTVRQDLSINRYGKLNPVDNK